MSLLIVEDDEEVRKVLARVAQSYFSSVTEAESAFSALTHLSIETPSVVITDWDLGGVLSGVDIANYVTERGLDCQLVIITGKSMSQLKSRTSHLKVHTYLAKPFNLGNLRSVLQEVAQIN